MNIFAERLKELREEREFSYVKLAKELGVSAVAIGRWERNLRIPNIVELKKIAEFFGVSADYLLGITDFI